MFKIQDDYGSVIPYDAKYFEIISDENTNYIEKINGIKYLPAPIENVDEDVAQQF